MADDIIAKVLADPAIFGESLEEFYHRDFIWAPYTAGELQIVLAKPFVEEGLALKKLMHKYRREYDGPELHEFYRMLKDGKIGKDVIIHIDGGSMFGIVRHVGASWVPEPIRLDVDFRYVGSIGELKGEQAVELEYPSSAITPLERYTGKPNGYIANMITKMAREQGIRAVDENFF